jgi:hypothetical protein
VVFGIVPIPKENVAQVWPLVVPLFRKGCEGTTVTPEYLRGVFLTEMARLWIVWAPDEARPVATFGTQVVDNKATIFAMAGSGAGGWMQELLKTTERWARHNGARQVVINDARLGWAKFLKGYEMERSGDKATYRRDI